MDQPVCWQLAADYTKFLFYEENPLETMENLIRVIYGPLFDNIDKLVDPHVNPIDYFRQLFIPINLWTFPIPLVRIHLIYLPRWIIQNPSTRIWEFTCLNINMHFLTKLFYILKIS